MKEQKEIRPEILLLAQSLKYYESSGHFIIDYDYFPLMPEGLQKLYVN